MDALKKLLREIREHAPERYPITSVHGQIETVNELLSSAQRAGAADPSVAHALARIDIVYDPDMPAGAIELRNGDRVIRTMVKVDEQWFVFETALLEALTFNFTPEHQRDEAWLAAKVKRKQEQFGEAWEGVFGLIGETRTNGDTDEH